jgi:short-subunit dehydrogenase involved in D-alanine esterification of teichoic acids
MDNRRKCTYDIDYKTPQPYTIQTVTTEPGDVILAHVSEDLDLDTVNEIWKQLKVAFPNNDVLIANEYILKGLTIIKPKTGTVNIHNHVDTNTSDVLDKWLHQNVEFNI